jgi:2-haloacid dehalogenase
MIKYILFDLDGTILDFNKGEKDAFTRSINKFSDIKINNEDALKFSQINDYYFNQYKNGIMDRQTFHFHRFDEIIKYLNINSDPIKCNLEYVSLLKYEAQIYDDVIEILSYLSNKYELYVASNGIKEVQESRMNIAGINKYFKKAYISEDVGYNKQNEGFFNYIFNDLNDNKKDEYVIIGDRLDTDILGGINAGIKTLYINRNNINNEIKPDYEIFDFNEIKNIL